MATIDGKYLLVEQESPTFDVDITTQPVEKDIDMADHVQRKARTMGITGQVSGPGAAAMLTYLKSVSDKGIIVKYVGRVAFMGTISGLATGHSYKIADGFTISFTLNEVRVAKSSYVEKLPTPIKAQAIKIVNSGTKQKKDKSKTSKGKSSTASSKPKKDKDKKTKKEKEPVKKVKFKAGSPWA
ncbi:phage baseplate protein [Paenibacillus sp. FSL M7-1414]|uniref:phage baseplate protein n=1 Tax=Paenibacillus sp. FSL M7-1414 TaxID=2921542 RepID=UPI0030F95CA5